MPLAPPVRPRPGEVVVVQSAQQAGHRLTTLPPLKLKPKQLKAGEAVVALEPASKKQVFLGFGGSITEASAEVLRRLSLDNQEAIVNAYFSKDHGLGYRFSRLHINSCDFSEGNWSCCQKPCDMAMKTFSIQRYHRAILPMVRRAAEAAGEPLKLVASPWSPPAWMKDTGQMCGAQSKLLPQWQGAWALHLARFAQALADEGLPLWAMTVQNEPAARTVTWEACSYTAEEERDFVRDFLGPTLEAQGFLPGLRLLVWDHNRDQMLERAKVIYSDPAAESYVWGMAFHWYPDRRGDCCFENVAKVHEGWPDKHLVFTEGCCDWSDPRKGGEWLHAMTYAENILRDLNSWTEAWIDWNIVLDQIGGPNHVGNYCSAPIMVDVAKDTVSIQPSYYAIGQFARYVQPKSDRISCSCSGSKLLQTTAFANPDGTIVVVALNRGPSEIGFKLVLGDRMAPATAPPRSVTTFVLLDPEA